MSSTPALSAPAAGAPFDTTTIERRDLGEHDVLIDIKFCGICHSDIHQVKDEWGGSIYPMVPGHEIAGVVADVGGAVSKFSAGDRVGVGCLVDSCGECEYCRAGEEQFCAKGAVPTYNGREYDGEPTFGGYSQQVVVKDGFVVKIVGAGAPAQPDSFRAFSLIGGRRSMAGSPIGGLPETQEMLDFCAAHSVVPEIESIAAGEVGSAYDRVERSDVRYRFVIDVATIG
jgi:D-arabinose 1-dehydrogenase-like Zn-dependent alcohol dehydrogenase